MYEIRFTVGFKLIYFYSNVRIKMMNEYIDSKPDYLDTLKRLHLGQNITEGGLYYIFWCKTKKKWMVTNSTSTVSLYSHLYIKLYRQKCETEYKKDSIRKIKIVFNLTKNIISNDVRTIINKYLGAF
jgi:hypothetical protein